MKKILALSIAAAATLGLAVPALAASAATTTTGGTGISTCPPGQFNPLCSLTFSGGLIGNIITLMFIIAIILALAWLVYGGIRWILSQGDKGKVDSARQHIIAALIGLIIVFLAYFLINIVLTFFNLGNIGTLQLPTITGFTGSGSGTATILGGTTDTNCGNNPAIACPSGMSCQPPSTIPTSGTYSYICQ